MSPLAGASRRPEESAVDTGGYTIETTLDLPAQEAAASAVRGTLDTPGDPTTAIASVQPGDGAIRTLFGGRDPALEFDLASQGRRQPGSSFKPYVYLALLPARIDPRSTFDSGSPRTVECAGEAWSVKNYEGSGGAITVGWAMVTRSTPCSPKSWLGWVRVPFSDRPRTPESAATRSTRQSALWPSAACARASAPSNKRPASPPLPPRAGAPPYSITRIKDRKGRVVFQHSCQHETRLDEKEAGVLNAVLQRVVGEGTGSAADIGRPVAGKAGTTENNGNAWFIGCVPQLSTAVWVGRPEGDVPMMNVHGGAVSGGGYPARIFNRYMRAALAGVPVENLYTASPDELLMKGRPDPDPSDTTVTTMSPDLLPPEVASPPTGAPPPPRVTTTVRRRVPVSTTVAPRPTTTVLLTTTTEVPDLRRRVAG